MTIIGIDPGSDGAIAFLGEDQAVLGIADIPTITVTAIRKTKEGSPTKTKKGNRREIDTAAVVKILEMYVPDDILGIRSMVFIERVNAMPKQGIASAFSFGKTAGLIEGVVCALKIPLEYVAPVKWTRAMMPGTTHEKAQGIITAKRLLPTASDWLTLAKHTNRADALLIALYGLRKLRNGEI